MDEVLEGLKEGMRRFRAEVYPGRRAMYERVMREAQRPRTLMITCADSRLQPDALTQAAPGEIFTTRNIGNVVPAYGETPGGVGAVLEYAVLALKVKHVVVCGHTDCGAMKALLDPASVAAMPTVTSWLRHAHAALSATEALGAEGEGKLRTLTEQNVLLQIEHVRTHPAVAGALARGELTISGWVYDIGAGEVSICEDGGSGFVRLD